MLSFEQPAEYIVPSKGASSDQQARIAGFFLDNATEKSEKVSQSVFLLMTYVYKKYMTVCVNVFQIYKLMKCDLSPTLSLVW